MIKNLKSEMLTKQKREDVPCQEKADYFTYLDQSRISVVEASQDLSDININKCELFLQQNQPSTAEPFSTSNLRTEQSSSHNLHSSHNNANSHPKRQAGIFYTENCNNNDDSFGAQNFNLLTDQNQDNFENFENNGSFIGQSFIGVTELLRRNSQHSLATKNPKQLPTGASKTQNPQPQLSAVSSRGKNSPQLLKNSASGSGNNENIDPNSRAHQNFNPQPSNQSNLYLRSKLSALSEQQQAPKIANGGIQQVIKQASGNAKKPISNKDIRASQHFADGQSANST